MDFTRFLFCLMDEKKEGDGGGGKEEDAKLAKLEEKIASLEKLLSDKGKDTDKTKDLVDKVTDDKKKKDDETKRNSEIESAAIFCNNKEFAKEYDGLLGDNTAQIFEQAKKETYDSTMEKADDIRANIVKDTFSIQANLDLLAPGQKAKIETFLKSTKARQNELSGQLFIDVIEPFVELKKSIKKAEEIKKANAGFKTPTKEEDEYEKKLIDRAKKDYNIKE